MRVAVVHGVPIGGGGLGVQSANAVAALASAGVELHVLGPGSRGWPRSTAAPVVTWHTAPEGGPAWRGWPILRRRQGEAQYRHDVALGQWAGDRIEAIDPALCYLFTHVALETLQLARANGIATVLDSPNGHIRHFRDIYVAEQAAWCGGEYRGHPTADMVARVEEEYRLADRIRVSSAWAKDSLVSGGIPADKVTILQQPVDLQRFASQPLPSPSGRLRVVFVGSLDLRKGFVYLLRAARMLDTRVSVELVGGTVDRCTRGLLETERSGLDVTIAPGDPVAAFHRAEVSVLPTLEDGSPFAAAEAMSCGRPLVITDCCGAAEWVEHERTGWVVPGRDPGAIATALVRALDRRAALQSMGEAARRATERRADWRACDPEVARWVLAPMR